MDKEKIAPHFRSTGPGPVGLSLTAFERAITEKPVRRTVGGYHHCATVSSESANLGENFIHAVTLQPPGRGLQVRVWYREAPESHQSLTLMTQRSIPSPPYYNVSSLDCERTTA